MSAAGRLAGMTGRRPLQSLSTGLPAWKRGQSGQVGNGAAPTVATSAWVRLVTLFFLVFVHDVAFGHA